MKKLTLLILPFFLIFTTCKKDDPVECEEHYTGTNCDEEIAPSKVWLKRIEFSGLMETSFNNQPWDDDGTNADIYLQLKDNDGNILVTNLTNTITDISTPTSFSFDLNYLFPTVNNSYQIVIMDEDSPEEDTLMDSFGLYPYIPGTDFRTSIEVGDSERSVKYEIELEW